MRTTTTLPLIALIALFALAAPTVAQSTGIPGFNDYLVNGSLSNSTSCTAVTLTTPTTLICEVSTVGPVPVFLLFEPNTCSPNFIPMLTCQGTTLDIQFSTSTWVNPLGLASAAGDAIFTAAIPPLTIPISFSTQAVMFPCGGLPLFSQAYDVILLP